jgi:hypothetical protein
MNDYQSRQQEKHARFYEAEAKKTEFKSSALDALAWAEIHDTEDSSFYAQRAIVYSILELARVTSKASPKK